MDMDKLEQALAANQNVRFIYVIPNFQNPTGWTMSLEKRKRLYDIAVKAGVLILEDDPYGELRYEGEDIPTLKSMDTHGIVLYAGSFSKTISPGLRVGYILGNKKYMDKMAAAKQVSDVHSTNLSQIIVHKFMEKYTMKRQLAEICEIYTKRLAVAEECIAKHMGERVSYVKPQGGLYIYCKLPEGVDSIEFCRAALEAGVAVVWGASFNVDPNEKSPYFRINFSNPTKEQLRTGIEILGKVLNEKFAIS